MARRTTNKRKRRKTQTYARRAAHKARRPSQSRQLRQEVAAYTPRRDRFIDTAGEQYSVVHSSAVRRKNGITFTPPELVEQMVALAQRSGIDIKRIVDPGAGTGRFTIAAARAFPEASVIAIEYDRELASLLLANLTAAGLGDRVQVHVADFRAAMLPRTEGATLFIGNPPYVRHHDIEPSWKQWYSSRLASKGIRGSQLAGLHAHFMVKTFDLAHEGDLVCYVTSAEWLDTGYGSALRALLLAQARDIDIALLDPISPAFADAMTTSAIVSYRHLRGASSVNLRLVGSIQELSDADALAGVRRRELSPADAWSRFAAGGPVADAGSATMVGDLFSVHRGQVTGNNMIWVEGQYPGSLPDQVLFPSVTRARDLLDLGSDRLLDAASLKRVIDLPADWSRSAGREAAKIERFIDWAGRQGGRDSYIAQHRKPWFKVGLREPAPIIMTYMARRPPKFVRNLCGARLINIAHGLYPREPIRTHDLDLITHWLNSNVSRNGGRTYAGGLTKFEPREVERLRLPALDELQAEAAPL
jgi:SAM-dependent methyltransferase